MTDDPPGAGGGEAATFEAALQLLPDGHACVTAAGELDAAACATIRSVLADAIAGGHRDVRVDLASLTFCDAAGIGELVRAHVDLSRTGRSLVLERVPGVLRRTLRLADAAWLLS